jgi:hypothetical protein
VSVIASTASAGVDEGERGPVDLRVRVAVEIAAVVVEDVADRDDRARGEHHRAEHVLLGLEVLGRHLARRRWNGRLVGGRSRLRRCSPARRRSAPSSISSITRSVMAPRSCRAARSSDAGSRQPCWSNQALVLCSSFVSPCLSALDPLFVVATLGGPWRFLGSAVTAAARCSGYPSMVSIESMTSVFVSAIASTLPSLSRRCVLLDPLTSPETWRSNSLPCFSRL